MFRLGGLESKAQRENSSELIAGTYHKKRASNLRPNL